MKYPASPRPQQGAIETLPSIYQQKIPVPSGAATGEAASGNHDASKGKRPAFGTPDRPGGHFQKDEGDRPLAKS